MDGVFLPADVGVELDRLFFAVWLVVTVDDALQLVFFLVANLLDVFWQLPQLKLFTRHHLQGIAHRVTRADVAVEMKHPQPFRRDVQQRIATNDQMQQCFVEHDAIVAGLDLAQHQALNFAQRLLYLRLLIRRHALLG